MAAAEVRRPLRNRELAAIHAAKRDLGLGDDLYRDVLWTIARVRTAADLDSHGRQAVLNHMSARGWKPKRARARRPHVVDHRTALVVKIRAQLDDLGVPQTYGDGIARRMFKVDRWEWCDAQQLRKIVAALAYRQKRQAKESS